MCHSLFRVSRKCLKLELPTLNIRDLCMQNLLCEFFYIGIRNAREQFLWIRSEFSTTDSSGLYFYYHLYAPQNTNCR